MCKFVRSVCDGCATEVGEVGDGDSNGLISLTALCMIPGRVCSWKLAAWCGKGGWAGPCFYRVSVGGVGWGQLKVLGWRRVDDYA